MHLADHLQFLPLHLAHLLEGPLGGLALQALGAGGPQLAQVVEVGIAEQDAGLGGMAADQGQGGTGHAVAGDVDQIEFTSPFTQQLLQGEHEGGMQGFDAPALEGFGVAAQPGQVGRQEADLPAQGLHQVHLHQGGMAARIPIGPGGVVIDEQGPAQDAAVLDLLGFPEVGFCGSVKSGGPLLFEQWGVDGLVALEALGRFGVAAIAHAFVVDHPGQGGVAHLQSCLAHLEGQVGVLVVGRRELRAEAAHLPPELGADGQGGPAGVIHLAGIGKAGVVGVAAPAVVPGLAVAPHDPTCLLQAPVGHHQLGAHQPGVAPLIEGGQQLLEPAGTGLGVVVEQHDVVAMGHGGAAAAGLVEAAGEVVAHHAHRRRFLGQPAGGIVPGAVVHHDQLVGHGGGGISDGGQAAAGARILAVHRDHDRHPGLVTHRQLQGLPRLGRTIGARLRAGRQGRALAVTPQRLAEQPLPEGQLGRQRLATLIGLVEPGEQAFLALAGQG